MNIVDLKIKSDGIITEKLQELVGHSLETPCVGIACILIHADGSAFISTKSVSNTRLQMLGAASDLVFTLAKDGDRE